MKSLTGLGHALSLFTSISLSLSHFQQLLPCVVRPVTSLLLNAIMRPFGMTSVNQLEFFQNEQLSLSPLFCFNHFNEAESKAGAGEDGSKQGILFVAQMAFGR